MIQFTNKIFNTNPTALHFPGRCYKKNTFSMALYQKIIEASPVFDTNIHDDCAIVTVASANVDNTMLFQQAEKLSINIVRLGKDIQKKAFSVYHKLTRMLEFVNQTEKKIILSIDANDVLFINKIQNIFDQYKTSYADKIIFSGEKKFSYFFKRSKVFDNEAGNIKAFLLSKDDINLFFSLNSGLYIARTDLLKEILPIIIQAFNYAKSQDPKIRLSDQSAWMYAWYKYNLDCINLDHKCSMFQTCHLLNDEEISFI
jgi:hypothetical protein